MLFQRQELEFLPDLLALHQYKPETYPYLLASTTRGHSNSRYSILMAYPGNNTCQFDVQSDCLERVDTQLSGHSIDTDLPFIGGWFVYLSYEYAGLIEPSLGFHQNQDNSPIACAVRIPAAIIIDHDLENCTVVAVADQAHLLDKIKSDIENAPALQISPLPGFKLTEDKPEIYLEQLHAIKRYIYEGDIFQANLSRNWQISFDQDCDAVSLFHRLAQSNPAPFASLIKLKHGYIISSSPERLISVDKGIVETRPIAGTYPRGQTADEDRLLAENLVKHPKERAEHVMLIDLERNDLGRICQPGSIKVDEQMIVETYQHVHHIVSSIRGELLSGQSVKDVLHAVFPGGTITGCPKVRCMQIINEQEALIRGAYTGSLGYISDHGRMDLNILIRSMTLDANGKKLNFRAGAGIVHDSIIEKELHETRHKARGMINVFQSDH